MRAPLAARPTSPHHALNFPEPALDGGAGGACIGNVTQHVNLDAGQFVYPHLEHATIAARQAFGEASR